MDRVLAAPSSGTPIPPEVRRRVEPHVGVDLGAVRVLTGPRAAVAAASLGARAFTAGSTVVLGRAESPGDVRLMAHEATHVAQQAGGPDRSAVHRTTIMRDLFEGPLDLPDLPDISVSDLVPQSIVDGVTDALRSIPGYRLLTQVIGTDPLTGEPVEADRQAMIDELLSYGPFGAAVGQALQGMHALGDVVTVVTDTLGQYRLTFTRLKADVDAAWEQFSVTNGIDGNVAIVARVIDGILADVRRFVTDLAERILAIVREAVLGLVEKLLTQDPAIAPVWSLATKVFHHDPLRGVPVEAATVDILADFLHLIGQDAALDQMRERGTLQQTADWLDTQFETFLELLHQATTLFGDAWAAIQPENLGTLLDTLPGLAQRAFTLIAGIGSFAGTVLAEVLALVKRSLLGMLSEHAHAIPGFRLISVIIGRNPFTDDEVARTAENLIGGFIALLPGGEATYQQLSETGVIGEAAARIESAMATLGITPDLVTRTFLGLWDTLSLEDLLTPVDAFERVVALFGEPIGRIVEFVTVVVQVVVELVLRLMNFPSELLASIVTQTVQAIGDIRRDPVGFLLHMLEALKAGFQGFFDHALDYLVQGLVSWLFRGLSQLGITIPTEISFASILGLVLEVLGLSMDFVWRKLGEHVGEERVAMIRENLDRLGQAWGFVQDVQERGVVAIWEYVVDRLSTLWSTILSMASEWIMSTIVTNGLTKLLSFLDPSGIMAVVNSCIAFFNAVQSAIEYVRDILEIVNTFVSTLSAVARGDITPGAQMIEGGLAASIPVALGFLAAQLGLGDVPEKIAEIIRSVREVVEAAIDWLVQQALRLGAAALDAIGPRTPAAGGPGPTAPDAGPGVAMVTPDGALVIDEIVKRDGADHHLKADGPDGALVLHSAPIPLAQMPDPTGTLAPLVTAYDQARAAYDTAFAARAHAVTSGGDVRATTTTLNRARDAIDSAVRAILQALKGTPEATHPRASAPNIGMLGLHGEQPGRIRGQTKSTLPGERIWQTESEHVLPFATGATLWQVLNLAPLLRGLPEDKEQTTLVIYERAARIKTPEDNAITRMIAPQARRVAPEFRRQYDIYLEQKEMWEENPDMAAPPSPERLEASMDAVEGALFPVRDEAVKRTDDAIVAENGECEEGYTETNSQRRGNEPPVPGHGQVAAAAGAQLADVIRLLRDAVDKELGL